MAFGIKGVEATGGQSPELGFNSHIVKLTLENMILKTFFYCSFQIYKAKLLTDLQGRPSEPSHFFWGWFRTTFSI